MIAAVAAAVILFAPDPDPFMPWLDSTPVEPPTSCVYLPGADHWLCPEGVKPPAA
jgi:hypothetical protein